MSSSVSLLLVFLLAWMLVAQGLRLTSTSTNNPRRKMALFTESTLSWLRSRKAMKDIEISKLELIGTALDMQDIKTKDDVLQAKKAGLLQPEAVKQICAVDAKITLGLVSKLMQALEEEEEEDKISSSSSGSGGSSGGSSSGGEEQAGEEVGYAMYAASARGDSDELLKLGKPWKNKVAVMNWQHPENYSNTLLMAAVKANHAKCVRILADSGASVDIADSLGETPLMFAAKCGYGDIVEVLVDNKALLDVRSRIGATAVYWASLRGHDKCLGILLRAGADKNIRNTFGLTPLQIAINEKHEACVALLQ